MIHLKTILILKKCLISLVIIIYFKAFSFLSFLFLFPLNKGYMRLFFSIIICLCLFLSLCIFCISHCIITLVFYRQLLESTQSDVYIYRLMHVDGNYLNSKKVYRDFFSKLLLDWNHSISIKHLIEHFSYWFSFSP